MKHERNRSAIINETARRTHRRSGSTLVERLRQEPRQARVLDAKVAAFKLEDQISRAMVEQGISATQLAALLDADKGMISRDLRGGISRANYQRIVGMAQALDRDVVTLVLPRGRTKRKKTLEEAFKVLERA